MCAGCAMHVHCAQFVPSDLYCIGLRGLAEMAAPGLEDQENVSEAVDQHEEEEGGAVDEEFRQVDTDSQEGFCKRCSVFIKESFERR